MDGVYVINVDEYSDIGTHWITLYSNSKVSYFDSLGVEHIPKEIKKWVKHLICIQIQMICNSLN